MTHDVEGIATIERARRPRHYDPGAKQMKPILWMTLGALLCATGCNDAKKAPDGQVKADAPSVKEGTTRAAGQLVEAIAAPSALKAPIADGVEPGFVYNEVLDMTMPATGGGTQRTVRLWVTELSPNEAADKLAAKLIEAGFEKTKLERNEHNFKRDKQAIHVSHIDFKPGDKNGLGTVDVTIITQ